VGQDYVEEVMTEKYFDSLMFVKNGNFLVEEVGSADDAVDFLEEWPEHRRDKIYDAARRACYAALDGRVSSDAARSAFRTWAEWAGILKEVAIVMPWIKESQPRRSGIAA
jgi:hypothetical protein